LERSIPHITLIKQKHRVFSELFETLLGMSYFDDGSLGLAMYAMTDSLADWLAEKPHNRSAN
jgi:hypothetical protein